MKLLQKWAAAYLIEQKQKPVTHSDLTYLGVDSNGLKYYGYTDLTLLPNCRRIELEKASIFMDAKLDPGSIEKIAAAIVETADFMRQDNDPKKRATLQARIIAFTEELKRREQYATPEHFHIEVAALLTVSQDENPAKIDREYHNKKVAQLRHEMNNGNAFFFKNRIYCELLNLSLGIETSLPLLFAQWESDQKQRAERLKVISSYSKSESSEKGKKNG